MKMNRQVLIHSYIHHTFIIHSSYIHTLIHTRTDYSFDEGAVPTLTKMELSFLRLSTDLNLSTAHADAVSKFHNESTTFVKFECMEFVLFIRMLLQIWIHLHRNQCGGSEKRWIEELNLHYQVTQSLSIILLISACANAGTRKIKRFKIHERYGLKQAAVQVGFVRHSCWKCAVFIFDSCCIRVAGSNGKPVVASCTAIGFGPSIRTRFHDRARD